jgi:hypothetical protein
MRVKFFSDITLDDEYVQKCQAIFDKLWPFMNRLQLAINVLGEYKNRNDTTEKALLKDPVTNFWIKNI